MKPKKVNKAIRVLVCDEDDDTRKFLEKFLIKMGHAVFAYASPSLCPLFKDYKSSCKKEEPCADVMILDDCMEGKKAIDFVEQQLNQGCKLTIKNKIVICNMYFQEDDERARQLGLKIFYRPFSFDELKSWIVSCQKNLTFKKK